MNRPISSAVAAALLLTLSAQSVSAAEPVNTPAIAQSVASADLIQRSSHAVREYVHAPVSNLWVFPTADANVVFVRYTAEASEHLLLVEMQGTRIGALRDLTTEVVAPETLEANAAATRW